MKKIITLLTFICVTQAHAQGGLSNMSFETWTTTLTSPCPVGWFGLTLSQQTTGAQQGSKYVRITTTNTTSPNNDGFLFLSHPIGPTSIAEGAPYTQKPTALNGFYKTFGLAAGDSVGIMSYLLKQGSIISYAMDFKNSNVSAWTSFSIPYSFTTNTPDTIWIYAASNIQGYGTPNAIGSTLDLDNLSFSFTSGIDESSIGTSFLTYPNPAKTEFNIISKDETAKSIVVHDNNGKEIDVILIDSDQTKINLEKYPAGIYHYSIRDKDNSRLFNSKFIKE